MVQTRAGKETPNRLLHLVLKVHSSIHSVLLQWVPGGPEAGRDEDGAIVTSMFHLMA